MRCSARKLNMQSVQGLKETFKDHLLSPPLQLLLFYSFLPLFARNKTQGYKYKGWNCQFHLIINESPNYFLKYLINCSRTSSQNPRLHFLIDCFFPCQQYSIHSHSPCWQRTAENLQIYTNTLTFFGGNELIHFHDDEKVDITSVSVNYEAAARSQFALLSIKTRSQWKPLALFYSYAKSPLNTNLKAY